MGGIKDAIVAGFFPFPDDEVVQLAEREKDYYKLQLRVGAFDRLVPLFSIVQ